MDSALQSFFGVCLRYIITLAHTEAGDAFIVIANNITNISDGLVVIVIVLIDDPTTP